mgnify:CR=1 FL=1
MSAQEMQHEQEPIKRVPLMIVLILGAFVAILNQTLLGTALPPIMNDLNLSENTVQWLQSIFMLVTGIMIPITAFFIERFSTRGLFLTAMGMFAFGTLVCAAAPNFSLLMAGRILQAAGAGIMMPLTQTILFLIYPIEKRGSAMGLFGLVISFAPAIGPALSGWLVEHFPWRSVFYVVFPIAILDIIIAYYILKNVTKRTNPKVDVLSILLSTLGFGGILYGFSAAGSSGWLSVDVVATIVVGLAATVIFIVRQFKLAQPILEFRVFKYRVFTLTTILGMIVFVAMIGSAVIMPLFTQNMLQFSPLKSGLVILPGAILMGLMNPITGRLFDMFGARWLAIIGLSILVATTFMLTTLSPETTFAYLTVVNAFRMLGISMVMMPVTTAGLNTLPAQLIPHGSAMNNTMRQVSGAVGTALLVSIMTMSARPEAGMAGLIHGVNVSFFAAGVFSVIGLILSFYVKSKQVEFENQQ